MNASSPPIRFYSGESADSDGRMLGEIWTWSDRDLEQVHDYIQWLFPLPERSAFNAAAPVLSNADIQEFLARAELRANLLTSFRRILAFYGLQLREAAAPDISRATDFAGQAANWLTASNHNFLRLTRIMRSLSLLGLRPYAVALLAALEDIAGHEGAAVIGKTTLKYWRGAAGE